MGIGKHVGSSSVPVLKSQKLLYVLPASMSTGEGADFADEKSIK